MNGPQNPPPGGYPPPGYPPQGQPPPGYPPQGQPPQAYAPSPAVRGRRPARFTVLAILNFVFGGVGLIFLLASLAVISVVEEVGYSGPPVTVLWVNFLVGLFNTVLLIAGGVGLLLVRKWGWALCMTYGILAITWNLIWAVVAGFNPLTVIGLAYPIVVVSLLSARISREAIA